MKVYAVSYITKEIRLYTKLSRVMDSKTTIQHNKLMQFRKFNVDVSHLQHRNVRKAHQHYTIYTTQHPWMKDYLQDSKAHWHSDHSMQIL